MGIQHDVLKLGCARRWDLFDIVQCLVAVNHPRVGIAMRHGAEHVSRCGGKDRKTVHRIHMCMCVCVCVCVCNVHIAHTGKRQPGKTQQHKNKETRCARCGRSAHTYFPKMVYFPSREGWRPNLCMAAQHHAIIATGHVSMIRGAVLRIALPSHTAQHSTAQHSTAQPQP